MNDESHMPAVYWSIVFVVVAAIFAVLATNSFFVGGAVAFALFSINCVGAALAQILMRQ